MVRLPSASKESAVPYREGVAGRQTAQGQRLATAASWRVSNWALQASELQRVWLRILAILGSGLSADHPASSLLFHQNVHRANPLTSAAPARPPPAIVATGS